MRQNEDLFAATRARLAAYFTADGPVNEVAVTLMAAKARRLRAAGTSGPKQDAA